MGVFCLDDITQMIELGSDFFKLFEGKRTKHDLRQQKIILRKKPAGNFLVFFEGSTRCFLLFHAGGKYHGGSEGNGQGIGNGLVMFNKGILKNIKVE